MVNYHKENPASLYGKPLSFYLSKTLLVIEVRPEVFGKTAEMVEAEYLLRVPIRKISAPQTDRREDTSTPWSVTPGRTTSSTVRWFSSPISPERRRKRESC